MKPIIGITGNMLIEENGIFPGIERAYVNNDYVEAVVLAGGIPVILPILKGEGILEKLLETVDGVLISGGFDINPLTYGEEPSKELEFIYPDRDEFDLNLIRIANKLGKPILGICRGLQILNVAFGGTLYQDISHIEGNYIKHFQSTKNNAATGHTVEIVQGTIIGSILGESAVVNSFHHQAVKKLADGFTVTARSKDGIIEAIEKKGDPFTVGVQWHPEKMISGGSIEMLEVFKKLAKASENL